MKEEAVARLALACLVLVAIWFGLMTFLLITQAQILAVVANIISLSSIEHLGPLVTGVGVILGIQIFAGTNILVQLGVALNSIFFGNYWYLDYGMRYLWIGELIKYLATL